MENLIKEFNEELNNKEFNGKINKRLKWRT